MHGWREDEGVKHGRTPATALHPTDLRREHHGFFTKDGRKIQVGDCALFQSGDAPPFIGIIRSFGTGTACKESYLKLDVNWLYRPADVKLAKGIPVEAAPNEVFYSFHKDVIPAASLLHPCKVAFLRKGIELPSRLSSFVCRRVYDIENKCLWWLTDQDYINERQEEVDQLLDRTRLEMHALQSGGRSPKNLSGPASTHPLKSGSDSVQNSGTSFCSQVKVKKRERSDQGNNPIKREHGSKIDDADSLNFRLDNMLKMEVTKITEKGRLANCEGVDKLVQLMQLDRAERKIDLAGRVLVADVIAATDRSECLGRFVQLRGVPVLDDWLQEVQKGKICDNSSPKEGDRSVEDLLLSMLHALDKLPVNLNALQTCNIGKSVNHLRNHKNLDIQKKSRSLIDTWKKRVDAEMTKINDAKAVASCQPDKPVHSDGTLKLPLVTGPSKSPSLLSSSMPVCSKESIIKGSGCSGVADFASMTGKEKNFTAHSHANNLPVSGDHAIMNSSLKEDLKNSTSLSLSASKMVGSSRHRRSNNGVLSTSAAGVLKDATMAYPSPNKTATIEKISQSASVFEKAFDVHGTDQGYSQRLIVRLPNPGRSPARTSGGTFDESSLVGNRASSPGDPDKHDCGDQGMKIRGDASQQTPTHLSVESWHGNDLKDRLTGSDEANRSQGTSLHDEHCRRTDETGKVPDGSRPLRTSSGNENDALLSDPRDRNPLSINALIESCAKFSEAGCSLAAGDHVGMNLLASVATGEISKSNLATSFGSPESSSAMDEEPFSGSSGVKCRTSCADVVQNESQPIASMNSEPTKNGLPVTISMRDEMQESTNDFSAMEEGDPLLSEGRSLDVQAECHIVAGVSLQRNTDPSVKSEAETAEEEADKSVSTSPTEMEVESVFEPPDKCKAPRLVSDCLIDCKPLVRSPSSDDSPAYCGSENVEEPDGCKPCSVSSDKKQEMAVDDSSMPPFPDADVQKEDVTDGGLCSANIDHPQMSLAAGFDLDANRAGPVTCNNACEDEMLETKETTSHHSTGSANHKEPSSSSMPETGLQEKASGPFPMPGSVDKDDFVTLVPAEPHTASKSSFDLNEGFSGDDCNQNEPTASATLLHTPAIHLPNPSPFQVPISSGLPGPIVVVPRAKRPFVPSENLLKSTSETGWKGSAATSAFRPAEPRKTLEMPLNASDTSLLDTNMKQERPVLDIDLNVPDDRVLEDMALQSSAHTAVSERWLINNHDVPMGISGGLDLDLNRIDENPDNGQFLASSSRKVEAPLIPLRTIAVTFQNTVSSLSRDFDLNGPGFDEVGIEVSSRSQQAKNSSVPLLSPFSGFHMNNSDLGNLASSFPPANSYPATAIPSFLPDRGEQPCPIVQMAAGSQRILGPVTSANTYGGDIYRGSLLSASPAMAYSHTTTFPYGGFPFGSSCPVVSTSIPGTLAAYVDSSSGGSHCFPAIHSQLMVPPGAVSSHYPRPYMISLPEGSACVGYDTSQRLSRPGLDLNSGPRGIDVDARDGRLAMTMRPLSVSVVTPQAFEEQTREYHVAGGILKRKEPDGGWDAEKHAYKQPSWQSGAL